MTGTRTGRGTRSLNQRISAVLSALSLAVIVTVAQGPLAAVASVSFTTAAGWRLLLDVPLYLQVHGLDCEAAALQIALA